MRKSYLLLAALLALLVGPAVAQLTQIRPVIVAPKADQMQAPVNGAIEPWMVPERAREAILKLRANNRDLKAKVSDSELQSNEAYRRLVALTSKGGGNVHAYCATRDLSRTTSGDEEACNRFACNPESGTCFRSCTASDQCGTNYRCETESGICRLQGELQGPEE